MGFYLIINIVTVAATLVDIKQNNLTFLSYYLSLKYYTRIKNNN